MSLMPSNSDERPSVATGSHEPEPSPEAVLLQRSKVAQVALFAEMVVVALLLAFNLALVLGMVPDWLGPTRPLGSEPLAWPTGEVSSISLSTMGTTFLPWFMPFWQWWGVVLIPGVLAWRWAMQVSTLHAALDVARTGRMRRPPLRWDPLLAFVVPLTAVFAAGHYASRLWYGTQGGAARLGWLPIAWCTVFVLRRLDVVPIASPLVMGVAGLVVQLAVLGLGIALVRRIDARTLEQFEQVRQAMSGFVSAPR